MMKYEEIIHLDKKRIEEMVSGSCDEDVMVGVLSAIYYYETSFAGETLLKAVQSSNGDLRISLMRLVETFMQMHRTGFLAPSFLEEMSKREGVSEEGRAELAGLMEGVREFAEMFKEQCQ